MPKVKETTVAYKSRKPAAKMRTAKQTAISMLKRLKDNVTYEEIMYEVYVLEKISQGLEDLDNGRTVSHEEVRKSLARWLK